MLTTDVEEGRLVARDGTWLSSGNKTFVEEGKAGCAFYQIPRLLTPTSKHLSNQKIDFIDSISQDQNTIKMSPTTAKQLASSALSLPNDTYIYSLARTTTLCAAISSDDSLRYFDPTNLSLAHTVSKAHEGITCLKATSDGKGLVTAGRDGTVRCWDERAKSAGVQMADRRFPFCCLLLPSYCRLFVCLMTDFWFSSRSWHFCVGVPGYLYCCWHRKHQGGIRRC